MMFSPGQLVRCYYSSAFGADEGDILDIPFEYDHITPIRVTKGHPILFSGEVGTIIRCLAERRFETLWLVQFDCYSRLSFIERWLRPLSPLEELAFQSWNSSTSMMK